MLDCRFREPVETTEAGSSKPFWTRILPQQKLRGYYRCFGLTAESETVAQQLALDDTTHNPYFHLNAADMQIVELEEISRDDAKFKRLQTKAHETTRGHAPDPIWFRDGGGYYW